MNTNSNPGSPSGTPMTSAAASRIQSASARAGGGQVSSTSFAARAMSAGARHANAAPAGGKSGSGGRSGGGQRR